VNDYAAKSSESETGSEPPASEAKADTKAPATATESSTSTPASAPAAAYFCAQHFYAEFIHIEAKQALPGVSAARCKMHRELPRRSILGMAIA